jgi:predicted nucleic acid-binding protein
MSNVLVDTSAWVEFFRPDGDPRYRSTVSKLIDDNEAVLCGMILSELLKGSRSDKEYRELEDRLSTLPYLETPETVWKKVGRTASLLLRKGVQVPTTDLLIATLAIENKIPVLHNDKHFPILARHTELKTVQP